MKIGGQLRVVSGMQVRTIGYDMVAALGMARALGYDEAAVAELLPDVEAVMVQEIRKLGGGS